MDMDTDNIGENTRADSSSIESDPRHLRIGVETFWEEETGLIVLEAQGKLFRVQRSILCDASSVFRDALSLPQPPIANESEQHEGKPLIRLSDNADELQCFLEALHNHLKYYESPTSKSVASMTAILRLSNKYDVGRLRKKAIKDLGTCLPTTLQGYDNSCTRQKPGNLDRLPDEVLENLFSAVEEASVQRFLPFVKYRQCTRISLSGFRHQGDDLITSAIPTLIIRQFDINILVISNSCEDLKSGCDPSSACSISMQSYFRKSVALDYPDPLNRLSIFERQESGTVTTSGRSCEECIYATAESFAKKRRQLWDDLPSIFGLPPWEKLLEDV